MSVLKVGIDMKKDNKDYPKDIDKKSWDIMTNFTINILSDFLIKSLVRS